MHFEPESQFTENYLIQWEPPDSKIAYSRSYVISLDFTSNLTIAGGVAVQVISESTDQGLHCMVKRAKFTRGMHSDILFDVNMLWLEGDRFVLTGFEKSATALGEVEYAQSWLCIMGEVSEVPNMAR